MMETRNVRQGTVISDENTNSRLHTVKQLVKPQPSNTEKRPALGDLGNKINNTKNNNVSLPIKKTAIVVGQPHHVKAEVMGPPQGIEKKINSAAITSKTHLPKKETSLQESNKAALKRTESIFIRKPVVNSPKDDKKSFSTTQLTEMTVYDPDVKGKDDPQMVTEYLSDIFSYLRELESAFPVQSNFMEGHQSTPKMRTILVNWLVDVQVNFRLCLETLHLCISIVDRYLQINKQVGSSSLQLVGTTAMFLACKYEEMYVPAIEDFEYVCDHSFTKRQIFQTELKILSKLEFNLGKPLSICFLRRYSKIAAVESRHHTLGKYILELALLNHRFSSVKPSIQAAAACCLSLSVLKDMEPSKVWSPTLVLYSTYKYSDFKDVLLQFASMLLNAETSKYKNIVEKYSSSKLGMIALNPKLKGTLLKRLAASSIKTK